MKKLADAKGGFMKYHMAVFFAACLCIDWTRLSGTVKAINLRDATVTIQNRDGDLLIVPVDYQVKMTAKHDETRDLKHLALDEKVTLIRIVSEKPKELPEGMAPPEYKAGVVVNEPR